ncbi:MAG: YbjQ family protein [Chloroflexi bacterium]|nr:YbjQ family protein [Chloroflexota bacterium]
MIMATTSELPGMTVKEVKGLVQGNTIRARNVGRDIMAGLRTLVGGEITEYTRLMTESRAQATQRMVDEAEKLGANTILGVRYTTSTVIAGAAELLAYGTAVVAEESS